MKVYFSKPQPNFGSAKYIVLLTDSSDWAEGHLNKQTDSADSSHVVSSQFVGNNHGRTRLLF